MTMRFQEGFENISDLTQGQRKYALVTGSWPTADAGRWNTAFRAATDNAAVLVTKPIVTSVQNTWTIGFGWFGVQFPNSPGSVTRASGIRLLSGGTSITANEQVSIEIQPQTLLAHEAQGRWLIVVRRAGTTLATGTLYLQQNRWYYIEFQVVVRTGTNGSIQVKVHEWPSLSVTTDINVSGINTANLGTDGADRLAIVFDSVGSASSDTVSFDDIYAADDSTYRGNMVIEGLDAVVGNGDTAQWELQGGATDVGHALLDSDSSNVTLEDRRIVSDTTGQISLCNFGDLTFLLDGTYHFVSMSLLARMESSGTRTLKPVFRHKDTGSPSNFEGDDFVVTDTNWSQFNQMFATNPVTAAAWDKNDINLGQWGVKLHA